MRRIAIAALLVLTPSASAAGPWLHVGPPAFPAMTAVAAQGNSLFGWPQNGDIWRADAGAAGCGARARPRTGTSILVASPGAVYVASTDPSILSRSTNGAPRLRAVRTGRAAARHQLRGRDGQRARRRCPRLSPRALVEPVPTWTRPRHHGPHPHDRARSARRGSRSSTPGAGEANRFRLSRRPIRPHLAPARNRSALLIGSPPGIGVASLVVDRVTVNRLWLIHNGRVARSDNGGSSWTNVTPPAMRVTTVVPSATRANNVHVLGLTSSAGRSRARRRIPAPRGPTSRPPPPAPASVPFLFATSTTRAAIATSAGVWTSPSSDPELHA